MSEHTCPKCSYPKGWTVKPDGIHELVPCDFEEVGVYRNATVQVLLEEVRIYRNVTVQVLRCKRCGRESIGWYRQENTVEELLK